MYNVVYLNGEVIIEKRRGCTALYGYKSTTDKEFIDKCLSSNAFALANIPVNPNYNEDWINKRIGNAHLK